MRQYPSDVTNEVCPARTSIVVASGWRCKGGTTDEWPSENHTVTTTLPICWFDSR
jgi:hypothetical protein